MKHFLPLACCLLGCSWGQRACAQRVKNNPVRFVNLGVGFHGPAYHSGSRPALVGSVEVGVLSHITLGATGSYYRYTLTEHNRFSAYSAGIRASYHLRTLQSRQPKKMDYYAGLGAAYYSLTYTDVVRNEGSFYVPVHVGARRLFGQQQRVGVFSELGFNDTGFLKAGLTYNW